MLCACVCACVCAYVYVHVCVHACVHLCVCMYVCVHVCHTVPKFCDPNFVRGYRELSWYKIEGDPNDEI